MVLKGSTPAATYTTLLHTEAGKTGAFVDDGAGGSTLQGQFAQPTILMGWTPQVAPVSWVAHRTTGIVTDTDTAIYTIPASTKSVPFSGQLWNAAGAGASTCFMWVQFGGAGTKYRLTANFSVGANVFTVALTIPMPFVLSAGDILGVNTSSTSGGASVSLNTFTYDMSSAETLKTAWALDPGLGTTLLYTVPASTKAIILGTAGLPQSTLGQVGNVWMRNETAGAINVYTLLNGVAQGAASSNGSHAGGGWWGAGGGSNVLIAADYISVNWASANTGGYSVVTVLELPA